MTPTALTDAGGFAWFSTVGDIERYLDAETTLEVKEELEATGWIFVVARNGVGGISWRSIMITPP
jgi:hypothetical protein